MKNKYTLDEIVIGCQKGEPFFQKSLYNLFSGKMLTVCNRYAKNEFEAEDILQTAFIKIFNNINKYRGEGSFEGWVRRIMINTSIESYRKNLNSLAVVDIEDTQDYEVSTAFDMSSINVKDLMNLIQSLSSGYRLVFNMYVIEGYSHKEISEQLGISEGASKSQLSRARAILREKILKMEGVGYEKNFG